MDIEERKKQLSDEEKKVLLEGGTETPFTGALLNEKREGRFLCKVCGTPLFSSDTKFDSGTGWPSFDIALPGAIEYVDDTKLGMKRTEARCALCHSHLGHVFDDGPTETGKRYCMNSVCLDFEENK
ncbi:MAG: msrB [Candidatus Nomurabacteria bacterium]|nr:msrB [Candidatus Nomurabacteria bacterium]